MRMRQLSYIETTTRAQKIIRILRYDFDRNQPAGVPRTMLKIPQTASSQDIPQTLSQPSSAAAAAVERRPIPPSGLTLAILQDYSNDELDAELDALGVTYAPNLRRFPNINMIRAYCAPSPGEVELQRVDRNIGLLRRSGPNE